MSILKDKTFENMDWLSQAIEPYHCELNDTLARMPEEFVLSYEYIAQSIAYASGYRSVNFNIDTSDIIKHLYKMQGLDGTLNYDDRKMLCDCFELVTCGDAVIDLNDGHTDGQIKLIKTSNQISDANIKRLMNSAAYLHINYRDVLPEAIMDLALVFYETDPVMMKDFTETPKKNRIYNIAGYLNGSAERDIFKIRSVEAYKKFSDTIGQYLTTNDQAKLGEIYRVVMMSRRGQVIYKVGS